MVAAPMPVSAMAVAAAAVAGVSMAMARTLEAADSCFRADGTMAQALLEPL